MSFISVHEEDPHELRPEGLHIFAEFIDSVDQNSVLVLFRRVSRFVSVKLSLLHLDGCLVSGSLTPSAAPSDWRLLLSLGIRCLIGIASVILDVEVLKESFDDSNVDLVDQVEASLPDFVD